jgi:BirA family biotin operon repressor/biotin-[acetyl-CoA-carboxylase] ligase
MPELIRLATVDSTMDVLHRFAAEGAETGTVVVAGEQSLGRGSRGRSWRSPYGGLWLSVLYRAEAAAGVELLSLRVGLAVAEAVESLGPAGPVQLKWPNDLIMHDRKLGGVLCETRWQGEALAWVLAGVGINVSNPLPDMLQASAIALVDQLASATPELVEAEVVPRLRGLHSATDRLDPAELARFNRRDWLFGRRLRGPAAGTAAGISDEGALRVRTDAGAFVDVRAGTVELAGDSRAP